MTEPLRIFHVAAGAQGAGGERFLLQMADHLDARAFRMAVLLPERGPLEEELRRRYIPFDITPPSPLSLKKMSRLFAEWKPNFVQAHGLGPSCRARLAAGNIPCISTIHTPVLDGFFLRRWARAAAEQLAAPRSAAVVCVAECLRDAFLQRCPSLWEKTHVIPNGVDLDRFDPRRRDRDAARRALNLGERWALLVVGRLTENKGHAVLLEALGQVKNTLPPFRVLFAGDGPLQSALRKKSAAMGLAENTVFLGLRHDIPDLLAAADVTLMPSLSEESPHALLEALSMGKPVIASRVRGVEEIMSSGGEGYLVPPRSPEKIVEALLTVLWNKDDARERAETGRRRVQREHDIKKTIAKWETLYRSLSGDILIE